MTPADLVSAAEALMDTGRWDTAARALGAAMADANPSAKPRIVALFERAAPNSPAAACNLGLALMRGDGIAADPERGAGLLRQVLAAGDRNNASFAHNFLGHHHCGAFGSPPDHRKAVAHFEEAGRLGGTEAAFNAGLIYEQGANGVKKNASEAVSNYRRAVAAGSYLAMTNLALMIMAQQDPSGDPDEAVSLLERASELGDPHASAILNIIDSAGVD